MPLNHPEVRVLHPEFYAKLDDEQIRMYEPIMRRFAEQAKDDNDSLVILPKDNLVAWSKVVEEWRIDCEYSYITIEQVCKYVQEKTEELKMFLEFLKIVKTENIFDQLALIPNREGVLRAKKDLRDGKSINDDLYTLVRPIIEKKLDKLVDWEYEKICFFTKYDWRDLQGDLSASIQELRNITIKNDILLSIEGNNGQVGLKQFIDFCSLSSNVTEESQRIQIIQVICKLFGFPYEPKTISYPKMEDGSRTPNIFDASYGFLLDCTFLSLSKKDEIWVKEHLATLQEFILLYDDLYKGNKEEYARLEKYSVIPNQLFNLHKISELKRNANIDNDFIELYKKVTKVNLRNGWCESSFNRLIEIEENPKDFGRKLEDEFFESKTR